MSQRAPAGQGSKRKSRIVIDVAKMQEEARSKRRGGGGKLGRGARILSVGALVVIGLLLLLAVGGYAWWQSYKKSPAYSIALLADAAQRDDIQTVDTLIDSDRIAQGFVPQVIDKLTGGGAGGAGAPGVTLPPSMRGQLASAMPQLLPRVRETMREEVARGVKGFAEQTGGRLPFFLFALGVPRAAEIKEQGDAATASVKIGDRPVELTLERNAERWKVVTLKDDAMATDIAARLVSSLPSAPAQTQEQQQPRRRGRPGR
ncbi:MAG TPA: hypothetical protein VM934_07160 [Pyrinomonadaceae bacterium]|jgi:hypothetical protein|nr:hypothetical protein [Pyrinomonadaceae bacterium]